jgi:hypothetical protein
MELGSYFLFLQEQIKDIIIIECVGRQSGSRLLSMVVINLQNCTWCAFPSMRAKRMRSWHISKSTFHGVCNGDVSLAQGDDEGTWPRSVCGSASIKKKIF